MGRFTSAALIAEDDPSIRVEFQLFVDSFSPSMSANYSSHDIVGRAEPYRVYSSSGPLSYSLSLKFSNSVSQEADGTQAFDSKYVTKTVSKLIAFTLPRKKGYLNLPPSVAILHLGTFVVDRCIVKSVGINFNDGGWYLFTPNHGINNIDPPVEDTYPMIASVSLSLESVRKIPHDRDTVLNMGNAFRHSYGILSPTQLAEQQ